jgi:hypothetical protein
LKTTKKILFFRRASTKSKKERGIFVKHFKNIPMADMEIVLVSYISFVSFDNFFLLQTNTIDDFANEIFT